MFEIGSSLREARERRGLALADVERETHIRSRYLVALEEDRFADMPGAAYAKGFLRTYAEFLGLEGQRFIDEYNSRFAPTEEPAATAPTRVNRRRRLDRVLLAIPIAAVLVGLIAWQAMRGGGPKPTALPPATAPTAPAAPTSAPHSRRVTHAPRVAHLVLVATRGPSWLAVHIGSNAGPAVYVRTLGQGETARFVSKRLWVRIGAPWNLDATVNGSPVSLPATTGNVVATAAGLTSG